MSVTYSGEAGKQRVDAGIVISFGPVAQSIHLLLEGLGIAGVSAPLR